MGFSHQDEESDSPKSIIPMNDEFKLRLPLLLDGSYSIQVSLFEVYLSDPLTELKQLADASIPLSSSAPRDGSPSGRVATAIPNGNHRLKLGNFQLQLESRLVSSVHVGDPSVAITLRDFPYKREQQQGSDHPNPGISASSGNSLRADSFAESDISFMATPALSSSSQSAALSHFYPLLHVHMWNLVNWSEGSGSSLPRATMRSLFELLNKVKCHLQPSAFTEPANEATRTFLKNSLDGFDECSLSNSTSKWSNMSADSSLEYTSVDVTNTSEDTGETLGTNDENDGGVVRFRRKSSSVSQAEVRVSRIVSALVPTNKSFSRVAYGATKTDRMRLEAELNSSNHVAPFFDDDETVATFLSMHSDGRRNELSNAPMNSDLTVASRDVSLLNEESEKSLLKSIAATRESMKAPRVDIPQKNSNEEFANRVRTVAQVMLAPCVGPSLSNILAGKSSPRRSQVAKQTLSGDDIRHLAVPDMVSILASALLYRADVKTQESPLETIFCLLPRIRRGRILR